jgi:hypothetical protein
MTFKRAPAWIHGYSELLLNYFVESWGGIGEWWGARLNFEPQAPVRVPKD